jgi:tryptophan synthase alpha chain
MNKTITSTTRVHAAFEKGHTAFMPYYTLGYPDQETALDIIEACVNNGADLMELGIPFSDPLADGPTIQHSTQTALQNGVTVERCLKGVAALRARGLFIPFMMMGYYNPILAYGLERFANHAHQAGADGFIIPDLPPEEAGPMMTICEELGLAMTFLLAPNSPPERIQEVTRINTGFIYLVSVTGITGVRDTLPEDLEKFIGRVRRYSKQPIAVGFGISNPAQARLVGDLADGVIVGSALITATSKADDPIKAAGEFVKAMLQSMHS